jgi:hypothetical protein
LLKLSAFSSQLSAFALSARRIAKTGAPPDEEKAES